MSILEGSFKNAISKNPHDFVNGRATVTNLSYTNLIIEALEGSYLLHFIYTNFSKAFYLYEIK